MTCSTLDLFRETKMLEKVNLLEAANQTKLFQYLKIGQLNNHALHVLQVENRTLDFHVHEQSDEMFYVLEGRFDIELDDGFVPLETGDMVIVPQGTRHRPVVKTRVKCLLMELDGTLNADNTGGSY
ncbi:MAG: cupin domain-containing protein [Burkholderiales bacterium]|jgi:mannose-6-phosphate isomerase-like protein (cupin superfamily)|nr:cupin domain-containing protein [Burkholderiales bacterium]